MLHTFQKSWHILLVLYPPISDYLYLFTTTQTTIENTLESSPHASIAQCRQKIIKPHLSAQECLSDVRVACTYKIPILDDN